MLLDRGPIDPVDVDAWTQPSARPTLAADASAIAAQLGAHEQALGGVFSALASEPGSRIDAGGALELGAAADAHNRQVNDIDTSIGAVVGNADAHTGEIDGLAHDTAADIAAGEPEFPGYEEHPVPGIPSRPPGTVPDPEQTPPDRDEPPPPGGGMYEYVASLYRGLLEREGSDGEIQGWVDTGLGAQQIHDAFIGSDEYRQKHGG